MQRKKMFLVVCISALLAGGAKGQNFSPGKGKSMLRYTEWKRETFLFPALPAWELSSPGKSERGNVLPDKVVGMGALRAQVTGVWLPGEGAVIPANRVAAHFGFFCKRELELEKTIRLPVRFRLGSLEYCNKLEGK